MPETGNPDDEGADQHYTGCASDLEIKCLALLPLQQLLLAWFFLVFIHLLVDQQSAHGVFDHPLHELVGHQPNGNYEKAQDEGTAFFYLRIGQIVEQEQPENRQVEQGQNVPDLGELLSSPGRGLIIHGPGSDDAILYLAAVFKDADGGNEDQQGGDDQHKKADGFQLGSQALGNDGEHQADDDVAEGPDQQPVT